MTGDIVRLPRRSPPAWQQEPQSEPLRPFYASQMEGREIEPLQCIVDGVLVRGTVCILAGAPKIGKTALLQQLLTSVALGADWLGRETVQSKTFGLFCEDPQHVLERRQNDILAHYDRTPADLEAELSWSSRDGKDAVLVEFERFSAKPKFTSLWRDLWTFVEEDGINLVGIDTAATVFSGNEVSREHVTAFLRALQKQALAMNGCIVLNVHPSKTNANGFSGSTAWLASARAGMSLGRPTDYDQETGEPRSVRVLRGLGSNYGAGITAERLEYRDGVFVTAEPEMHRKRGSLSYTERQDLKYRLLIGVKRAMQNGERVPAGEMDPKSISHRARRSTDPSINRISLNDLNLAQHEMLESGLLVRVDVGGRCLVRPHDGPWYAGETTWQMPKAPPSTGEK